MVFLCMYLCVILWFSMIVVVLMLVGGSELIIFKFVRYDVCNYSDLDFKFLGMKSDK